VYPFFWRLQPTRLRVAEDSLVGRGSQLGSWGPCGGLRDTPPVPHRADDYYPMKTGLWRKGNNPNLAKERNRPEQRINTNKVHQKMGGGLPEIPF
jgi:hypothetical protein